MSKVKLKERVKRRRITLSFVAPQAREARLMGDFNGWNAKIHPMKRNDNGLWTKIVMLAPGTYEYKFLVDGEWQNDPGVTSPV